MILFSTLQQGWGVWLFCYLGFLSGVFFFASYSLTTCINNRLKLSTNQQKSQTLQKKKNIALMIRQSTKIDKKNIKLNKKKSNNRLSDKKDKKRINYNKKEDKNAKKYVNDDKKQSKNKYYDKKNSKKDKKRDNIKKKYKNIFKEIHTFCLFLWKFLAKFSAEIILIVALCGGIVISFLVNLQLNYGILSPPYIALWLGAFVISKYFIKSLAKIFQSIYNKFKNSKVAIKQHKQNCKI